MRVGRHGEGGESRDFRRMNLDVKILDFKLSRDTKNAFSPENLKLISVLKNFPEMSSKFGRESIENRLFGGFYQHK